MAADRNIFVLRHGHSLANEQGLIVSDPDIGIERFGLSKQGRDEVRSTLETYRGQLGKVSKIYSSDFLRTRQTTEIAAEFLKVPVETRLQLRERKFGDLDGKSNENYQLVWQRDGEDASHQDWNVESVASVAQRMTALVTEIDQTNSSGTLLLVSHGDPLQILLAAWRGIDLRQHRQIEPIRTAELRVLESRAETL